MTTIHKALNECSTEHPVFYEGEVYIHLNPEIGADWQSSRVTKHVVTPGQNEKYYLAKHYTSTQENPGTLGVTVKVRRCSFAC